MKWIDNIPMGILVAATLFMAAAPITPEPHLLEKFRMLTAGTLTRPLDIFDVLWHLAPAILLATRLLRARRQNALDCPQTKTPPDGSGGVSPF